MRHSVRARSAEIEKWFSMSTDEVIDLLTLDLVSFREAITDLEAPTKVIRRAEDSYLHLPMWIRVMTELG